MAVDQEMDSEEGAYKKKLLLLALTGAFFVMFSDSRIDKWLKNELFIHLPFVEVGFAFLIAFLLGWAIDTELKRGLVRDAVRSALGYLLPDALKPELRWVYEQKFLAMQTYHVRLQHDEEKQMVFFHGHVTRIIKNTSGEKAEYEVGGGTDEWFHPSGDEGVILGASMTRNNVETVIPIKKHVVGMTYGLDKPIVLEPGEEIEVSFSYRYAMYECGMELLTFGKPIADPLVTVEVPPTLRARVLFSNRMPTKIMDKPAGGYLSSPLKGVLLPFQDIRVYWYTERQLEAREKSLVS